MTAVVLDASAGVEILLKSPAGQRLRRAVPPTAEFWVPELYFAEVASGLRRAEYVGAYSSPRVEAALTRLLTGPFEVAAVKPLIRPAWRYRKNMTVPDAAYVVLALALRAPLVTADVRLANAPGLPVQTITP